MPPSPATAVFATFELAASSALSTPSTNPFIWPVDEPASKGPSSLWNGVGGPALIIVFVAIGLLCGAFSALLIVRRMPSGRSIFGGDLDPWFLDSEPVLLGDEPKLYSAKLDVCGDGHGAQGRYSWGDVMPLSTKFIPDHDDAPLHEENDDPATRSSSATSPIRRFLRAIKHYYVPPRPTRGDDTSSIETHVEEKADLEEELYPEIPVSGKLQVAMVISMPHPSTSIYYGHDRCSQYTDDTLSVSEVSRRPGSAPIRELSLGLTTVQSTMTV